MYGLQGPESSSQCEVLRIHGQKLKLIFHNRQGKKNQITSTRWLGIADSGDVMAGAVIHQGNI